MCRCEERLSYQMRTRSGEARYELFPKLNLERWIPRVDIPHGVCPILCGRVRIGHHLLT